MQAETSPFALYSDPPPQGATAVDVDPFSLEFFADPYPSHAALRDAGRVVWLSRYNISATARYEEVRQALHDHKTFSSARGVGLADFSRHGRFRLPSLILEVDPPTHSRSRAALMKALSPTVMRTLRASFAAAAEEMVAGLVKKSEFDACSELAEAYPLKVFPDAIGMRPENRHNLLPYGDMVFNSFGPPNELFQAAAKRAQEIFPWVEAEALRQHLKPGGFGMILYQCADAGEITEDEAHKLVRSMLTAGVDTTVNGIGAALYSLARFPEQWKKMCADPARLAKAAFEEAVRFESPVQTFFEPRLVPPSLAACNSRRDARSFCSSAQPIAILVTGKIQTNTTSNAKCWGMSVSVPASTSASANFWRDWRVKWCCRRSQSRSVESSSPASLSAVSTILCVA